MLVIKLRRLYDCLLFILSNIEINISKYVILKDIKIYKWVEMIRIWLFFFVIVFYMI